MSALPATLALIPRDTRMEANGEGAAFDISASATRTFLCRLTVTDQIEQESLAASGNEIHSCSLGVVPLGQSCPDAHVCCWAGARGDPAHVPRDPHDTNSSCHKIAREAQALPWTWHPGPLLIGVGSLAAKSYINRAVSSGSGCLGVGN